MTQIEIFPEQKAFITTHNPFTGYSAEWYVKDLQGMLNALSETRYSADWFVYPILKRFADNQNISIYQVEYSINWRKA